jgi:hypothetical protein
MSENLRALSPPPSPQSQVSPPRGGLCSYSRDVNLSGPRMTLGTRLAGTFDCPDSPVGATASARSILAAVSAIRPRRLGKHYNAHSRGCAISGGPTDNKFGLSHFTTNFAGAGTPVRGRNLNAGRMSVQELFFSCGIVPSGNRLLFNNPMRLIPAILWIFITTSGQPLRSQACLDQLLYKCVPLDEPCAVSIMELH